jgi:DnaK suppressor protein
VSLAPAELRHFERLLRKQRAERSAELRMLTIALEDVREARGESTADDEHDPDGPTLSVEWSRISGLHRELAAKSRALDRAFERIADGSYGVCLSCGADIGRDRLEARPATEHCIDCARRLEGRRGR